MIPEPRLHKQVPEHPYPLLYLAFFRCDNAMGDTSREPLRWFEEFAARRMAI